jgi:hypothetical protein
MLPEIDVQTALDDDSRIVADMIARTPVIPGDEFAF